MPNLPINPQFNNAIPAILQSDPVHADGMNALLSMLLGNDVHLHGRAGTAEDRLKLLESSVSSLINQSAVGITRATRLDWDYSAYRAAFELWLGDWRMIDDFAVAVTDTVAGDETVNVSDTSALTVGASYVIAKGPVAEVVTVAAILTPTRFRATRDLTNSITDGVLSPTNWTKEDGFATVPEGGVYFSAAVDLGSETAFPRCLILRTDVSTPMDVAFIDAQHPDWTDAGWTFQRVISGRGAGAKTSYDTEYAVPAVGPMRLRITAPVACRCDHIVGLTAPSQLGGTAAPPLPPVIRTPAPDATGVSEVPTLSVLSPPTTAGLGWAATEWQLKRTFDSDWDTPLWQTVQEAPANLTAVRLPAGVLAVNLGCDWRVRVQDDQGRWSDWAQASFTCAPEFKYIVAPEVVAPADGDVTINAKLDLTLRGSAFAVTGGSDTLVAQQWQVRDDFGVVWTSDEAAAGDVILPAGVLTEGWKRYSITVRHKGAVLGWSEGSTPVTITTIGYSLPPATTSERGGVVLATTTEAKAGIDNTKVVTPAGVAAHVAALPKAKAFIKGMILPFSGTFSGIYPIDPATGKGDTAWQLCDGSNGTPNLRDRFVVGAGSTYAAKSSGGAASHTHSFSGNVGTTTLTTTQMPSHSHDQSYATSGIQSLSSSGFAVFATQAATNSIQFVRGEKRAPTSFLGGGGSHTHSLSTVSTSNASNLPPYYALSYIMYMGG